MKPLLLRVILMSTKRTLIFFLKYRPSMRIFVYGLCFQVMPNATQVLILKKKLLRMYKPQLHRIAYTFI